MRRWGPSRASACTARATRTEGTVGWALQHLEDTLDNANFTALWNSRRKWLVDSKTLSSFIDARSMGCVSSLPVMAPQNPHNCTAAHERWLLFTVPQLIFPDTPSFGAGPPVAVHLSWAQMASRGDQRPPRRIPYRYSCSHCCCFLDRNRNVGVARLENGVFVKSFYTYRNQAV